LPAEGGDEGAIVPRGLLPCAIVLGSRRFLSSVLEMLPAVTPSNAQAIKQTLSENMYAKCVLELAAWTSDPTLLDPILEAERQLYNGAGERSLAARIQPAMKTALEGPNPENLLPVFVARFPDWREFSFFKSGWSEFFNTMCEAGDVRRTKLLLESGFVNLKDEERSGSSPLGVACRAGHLQLARYLTDRWDADPMHVGRIDSDEALEEFASHFRTDDGFQESFNRFVERSEIFQSRYKANALVAACASGDIQVLRFVLDLVSATAEKQVDLIAPLKALMRVTPTLVTLEMLGLLMQRGLSIGPQSVREWTDADRGSVWKSLSGVHSPIAPQMAQCLLSHGFIADTEGDFAPLLLACSMANLPLMQFWIDRGMPVPSTALHEAAKYQKNQDSAATQLRAMGLLLSANADVNVATSNGVTALHLACETSSLEVIQMLLSAGANVNATTVRPPEITSETKASGMTPLHLACGPHCSLEIIQTLISAGANVNAATVLDPEIQVTSTRPMGGGVTPLHLACQTVGRFPLSRRPSSLDIIRALVSAGANVNATAVNHPRASKPTTSGTTPLHYACQGNDSLNIAQILLTHGANLNAVEDTDGATPLHYCIFHGEFDCALYLIRSGADVNSRLSDGCTPLHLAMQRASGSEAGSPSYALVESLLERGADALAANRNSEGLTPLCFALMSNPYSSEVRYTDNPIEYALNVYANNRVLDKGRPTFIRLLLSHGATVARGRRDLLPNLRILRNDAQLLQMLHDACGSKVRV
jgi:ankyrin repeat protein